MPNDAQGKAPTFAEEAAKFSGFATNDGETVDPKTTTAGPGDRNLSDDEAKAGAKVIGEQPRTAAAKAAAPAPAAAVKLTDAESTAALDKARTTLKLEDGEELTDEEKSEALAAALTAKKSSTGRPADERVRIAQKGRRAAEARAAKAETKLSDLERRLAAIEQGGKAPLTADGKPAKGDTTDKEPDASTFELGELDPKYIRALARWEVRQELADNSKNQETQQRTSQQEAAAAEIMEKKAAFEDAGLDAFEDFQEVVMDTISLPKSDPAAWPLSATVGRLLLDSEFGPQIAYALASDPKEAKRVDKLADAEKQRWFFRQEAKFEADKASGEGSGEQGAVKSEDTTKPAPAAPRTLTKAPTPPRRNNGGASNRGVSSATTDFAAFEALVNGPQR